MHLMHREVRGVHAVPMSPLSQLIIPCRDVDGRLMGNGKRSQMTSTVISTWQLSLLFHRSRLGPCVS
jgi:hypothetical protein